MANRKSTWDPVYGDILPVLGPMIRKKREELGYTRQKLAGMVGVQYQTIWKIEAQDGLPCLVTLVRIAESLDLSTDDMLGLTGRLGVDYEHV